MDDRRDGVEEGQRVLAGQGADRLGERRRGQRAGGDDDVVPVVRRQGGDFAALDPNERLARDRRLDRGGKAVAIDRQRAAGRHLMGVGRAHDERTERAHLAVDDADRVVLRVVGAKGIGADELGEALGAVRFGAALRAHFVQNDGNAGLGDLPGRFAAGQAAADDVNGAHGGLVAKPRRFVNPAAARRRAQRKRPPGEDPAGVACVGRGPTRLMRPEGGPDASEIMRERSASDEVDVAAADADVVQFAVAELRQFANGFAIAAPGVELLGDGLERGHWTLHF